MSPKDGTSEHICFHCSQTLDNFHNFAVKIKNIQKIIASPLVLRDLLLLPPTQELIQTEEITILVEDDSSIKPVRPKKEKTRVMYAPRTRSKRIAEKEQVFEQLKQEMNNSQPATFDQEIDETSEKDSNRSFDYDENEELYTLDGSSDDNDFPSRDSDNEDWPSTQALSKIPKKIIQNGTMLYKGKKLMRFLSKFYNLNCALGCIDMKFKRIPDLFDHYKTDHKVEPYVTCCSTKLSKLPKIIMHFARHIQPEAFQCHICSYAVSRPKFLELHLQTHLPEKQKPYSCDSCDKRFIWKGALLSHLTNHQPASERKRFVCSICTRHYQTAGSLSSHKKAAHSGSAEKSRRLCEQCSKSFSTLTSYKEHLITHREDRDKLQLQCKTCQKWLKNQRCLKSHMLLHSEMDLKCQLCDYTTKKPKLLENHNITRHTSERNFICDKPDCGKSFKVKRALTIHKAQNHSDDKTPGKCCEFCKRTFANSSNYYAHRKNLHAAELKNMLIKKIEEEKLKRVKVGLEPAPVREESSYKNNGEILVTLSSDGTIIS